MTKFDDPCSICENYGLVSILIESMEMPESCFTCPFRIKVDPDNIKCIVTREVFEETFAGTIETRNRGKCPLVPVPPHGRLIDADKQDAQIEALIERHLHGYTKSTWDFVCELRDILKRNPTVIPEERGEKK